jgi:hypothetical protein
MGNFFSDAASSLGLSGTQKSGIADILSGGAGVAQTNKWIDKSTSKDRSSENADKAAEAAYNAQMVALGTNELGQYSAIAAGTQSGITTEQQTAIDQKAQAETAQMRQSMVDRGMTDSTTRLSGEAAVTADKIASQEATTQATEKEHWDAAVAALGLGETSSQVLASMNETDRQQAMQIYSSTMSVMGSAAGSNSGTTSVVNEYSAASTYVPNNTGGAGVSSSTLA